MEKQWLCCAGVIHKKINGRGKSNPKGFIEQWLKRLNIESELLSEDLMLEDAEAREEDLKF